MASREWQHTAQAYRHKDVPPTSRPELMIHTGGTEASLWFVKLSKFWVICADSLVVVARRLSTSFGQSVLPVPVHSGQDSERDPAHSLSLRYAHSKLFLPGYETPIDDRSWTAFVLHGSG